MAARADERASSVPAQEPRPEGGAAETPEQIRGLIKKASYAEAEEAARRLLAMAESRSGSESLPAAEAIDLLVEALARGGKTRDPSTLKLAERAVAIRERLLGPKSLELSRSLVNLGKMLLTTGDYANAKTTLERALGIAESAVGTEHAEYAGTLGLLGLALEQTGDPRAARAALERALAIQEKVLGPDDLDLARPLNNLCLLLRGLGEFREARERCERALAILEKGLGPNHPDLAATLTNLANVLADMGDYAGARPLYERALRIRENALGPEHPDVAKTLTNLGQLYGEMGDLREGKALHARALAIREKTLSPDHPSVASTLNNLAMMLSDKGEEEEAKGLYERALAIREKAMGPDHPDVAATLHNLATLLAAMGDGPNAAKLFERAITIRTKALGPENPFLAASLAGLATTLRGTGDEEKARALFERALAIREKQFGPDHSEVAVSLKDLAALHWDGGRRDLALAMADRASRILDRHARVTLAVLPERKALQWVASRGHPEEVLFSALLFRGGKEPAKSDDSLEACWNWTLRRRGIVLDELAARNRAAAEGETVAAREAWNRLAEARRRLAALWVKGPDPGRPEAYVADLDAARRAKEQAETELASESARFRRVRAFDRVELRDVVEALPSSSALVEIVRVNVREPRAEKAEAHDIALIIGPEKKTSSVDLGSSQRIDRLVEDWRARLRESSEAVLSGGDDHDSIPKLNGAGRRLREIVWDPIMPSLGRTRILFMVPEGALHQVNFEALPAKGGGYLLEDTPAVHLLSSGRDLLRLTRGALGPESADSSGSKKGASGGQAASGSGGQSLLALGAPDFEWTTRARADTSPSQKDAGETTPLAKHDPSTEQAVVFRGKPPACLAITRTRWSPLGGSLREVRKVAELFKNRGRVSVLTGEGASEDRFKQQAPGKRFLHLATHGFFLQRPCEGSSQAGAVELDNPLLLSGLVLAGANHAVVSSSEGEDGILTAEEVAALDLGAADLAILSACDTGSGTVKGAEGVFGLRRALELAGVRSVVMSLWPVPDRQAQRWMVDFYGRRLAGGTIVESSRQASLAALERLRKEGRPEHPYLWAGFVTAGDWR